MDGLDDVAVPVRPAREDRDTAFAAYMAARQPGLLRTAYLLTGNRAEAEDLVQTTLAKLYLSWERVREHDRLDAYVRRIMVNTNSSVWRRQFKRREVAVDRVPDTEPSTDAHDDGERAWVWELIRGLPARQRAVLVLRYYEDLSEAEIAATLGISVGTVKSQASRGMAALRARVPAQRTAA